MHQTSYRTRCTGILRPEKQSITWVTSSHLVLLQSYTQQSKHLRGELAPPVSNEKVYVTNNEHFLKLYPEGQLGPPSVTEIVCLGRKMSTFSSCILKASWEPPSVTKNVC